VFVDEFKARLQERCGNKKGKAETNTAGDRTTEERARTPRKRSGGWSSLWPFTVGFMKHDGQVLQGAASNYGILMREVTR